MLRRIIQALVLDQVCPQRPWFHGYFVSTLSNGGHNDQHHEDETQVSQNVTATFVVRSVSSYTNKKETLRTIHCHQETFLYWPDISCHPCDKTNKSTTQCINTQGTCNAITAYHPSFFATSVSPPGLSEFRYQRQDESARWAWVNLKFSSTRMLTTGEMNYMLQKNETWSKQGSLQKLASTSPKKMVRHVPPLLPTKNAKKEADERDEYTC